MQKRRDGSGICDGSILVNNTIVGLGLARIGCSVGQSKTIPYCSIKLCWMLIHVRVSDVVSKRLGYSYQEYLRHLATYDSLKGLIQTNRWNDREVVPLGDVL
jgi:hypothetical protein